jgi:hypothetical protein
VVSADPAVRSDWARYFEALSMRTLRCVGPQVLCVLLDGAHCPLHEEADLAIYDRAALTPELTLRLIRAGRSLPIAFAADKLEHFGTRRERRPRRAIERARLAFVPHDEPGDAADAAPDGRGDPERERGRERRVERVSSFAEDLDAGLRREWVGRDHSVRRDGLGLREDPLAPG